MAMSSAYARQVAALVSALVAGAMAGPAGGAARPAAAGQWRTYGADLASTRYSPLDQITAENFGTLRIAWRFRTDNFGPRPELAAAGDAALRRRRRCSRPWASRRTAVSLDPAIGELLWAGASTSGRARSRAACRAAAWPTGRAAPPGACSW